MTRTGAIASVVLAALLTGSAAAQDDPNVTIVEPGDAAVTTTRPADDPGVTIVGDPEVNTVTVGPGEGTPIPGTIFQQSQNTPLASTLMDVDVVNGEGEDVGDVVDLLLTSEGALHGVVMEVGGFLGIGEKTIAVEFARMEIVRNEDGEYVFRLNATEDEVDDAPEFVSLEDVEEVARERAEELAEERAEQAEAPLEQRAEELEERADELKQRADEVEERTEQQVQERAEERIEQQIVE